MSNFYDSLLKITKSWEDASEEFLERVRRNTEITKQELKARQEACERKNVLDEQEQARIQRRAKLEEIKAKREARERKNVLDEQEQARIRGQAKLEEIRAKMRSQVSDP